jgi:Lrp/AsnC family transcriptional regulator, leucine-responsive regulatory protein
MNRETDKLRPKGQPARRLDTFDRKILSAMTENARLTYAEIGERVGLSAPAVHERVRRLAGSGALKGTSARIDGDAVGKPFLAFVHVDADGWGKSERMIRLNAFPEVEEMHSVAGDTCVVMKVRTAGPRALEEFLAQVHVLDGVRSTRSYVVLSTYLERPVQAGVTEDWPVTPLPIR